jgi:hypothetical protein
MQLLIKIQLHLKHDIPLVLFALGTKDIAQLYRIGNIVALCVAFVHHFSHWQELDSLFADKELFMAI